jgi:hypothetical protein
VPTGLDRWPSGSFQRYSTETCSEYYASEMADRRLIDEQFEFHQKICILKSAISSDET